MEKNNEIQELIKKAVTSKSLEVLTEAEAQILVDSQTCRPGMVSFFYSTSFGLHEKCNFCPVVIMKSKKSPSVRITKRTIVTRNLNVYFVHY